MRKKVIFPVIIIIATVCACKLALPGSVELKTEKLKVNVPVRAGAINMADIIVDMINSYYKEPEDSEYDDLNPKNNMEIYDMVNYPGMQAFLVGYNMDLTESFNPNYYLNEIKKTMNTINSIDPSKFNQIDAIDPDPIKIDKITPDLIQNKLVWLSMNTLFETMENEINSHSMPVSRFNFGDGLFLPTASLPIPFSSWPSGMDNLPNIMAFKITGEHNFFSVNVFSGEIELTVSLIDRTGEGLSGLSFTLPEIVLRTQNKPSIGTPDPLNFTPVVLNEAMPTATLRFSLAGEEIEKDDPPKLEFKHTDAIITNNGPGRLVNIELVIQPQLKEIALNGAQGLRIGSMTPDIPPEVQEAIEMKNYPEDFLNAVIAKGSLNLKGRPPEKTSVPGQTYCENAKVVFTLIGEQTPVVHAGAVFPGISGANGVPWIGQDDLLDYSTAINLAGETLCAAPLKLKKREATESLNPAIHSHISITMQPMDNPPPEYGINFQLFDGDIYESDPQNTDGIKAYTDKALPVFVDLDMLIEEFKIVHWKFNSGDLFGMPDIPEIDFSNVNGTDISKFIEEIKLSEVAFDVDFIKLPPALQGRMALEVVCSDFGLDSTKILSLGENNYTSNPAVFYPRTPPLTGTLNKAKIEFNLFPVIGAEPEKGIPGTIARNADYIELGPLQVNNDPLIDSGQTILEIYGEVNFESFKWEYAWINFDAALDAQGSNKSTLSNTFPRVDRQWDLSEANQYLKGFSFSNKVSAEIFIGGPNHLINLIEPSISFDIGHAKENAQEGDPPEYKNLFHGPLSMFASDNIPKLPGINSDDNYVFTGTTLPFGNQGMSLSDDFYKAIASFPLDLHFKYEIEMPTRFKVEPDTFEIEEDSEAPIKALMVMLVPLEFVGEPGASIMLPPSIFGDDVEEGKVIDLFGREINPDGTPNNKSSPLTDVNVKKLQVKFDFQKSFFSKAYLHLDKNNLLFPNGLNLNNGQNNSLTVTLNGKDMNIVLNNVIEPDIKITFPYGTLMQIPRKMLPTRITLSANGSYLLDIDDLLHPGND